MPRRAAHLALACGVLLGSAEAWAQGGADPTLAELGSALYLQHCASCHGVAGRGDGPVAISLRVEPADLTRIAQRNGGTFPDADIARFIDGRSALPAHGPREMPIWGRRLGDRLPDEGLSDEIVRGRIHVLVEYLKSIQSSD